MQLNASTYPHRPGQPISTLSNPHPHAASARKSEASSSTPKAHPATAVSPSLSVPFPPSWIPSSASASCKSATPSRPRSTGHSSCSSSGNSSRKCDNPFLRSTRESRSLIAQAGVPGRGIDAGAAAVLFLHSSRQGIAGGSVRRDSGLGVRASAPGGIPSRLHVARGFLDVFVVCRSSRIAGYRVQMSFPTLLFHFRWARFWKRSQNTEERHSFGELGFLLKLRGQLSSPSSNTIASSESGYWEYVYAFYRQDKR